MPEEMGVAVRVEDDKRIMTPIVLGLIALGCWVGCALVAVIDLYFAVGLSCLGLGLFVPGALACGLFGVITSLTCVGKSKTTLVVAALVFNVLTPFVMVGSLVWFTIRFEV